MNAAADARHAARLASLGKPKRKASADRWARLNAFMDITMRTITAGQSSVWVYLFRHERNGTVNASVRQIAEGTGMTRNGAHGALQSLIKAGLVEVLRLSRHHGEASVYRLHHKV